MSVVTSSLETCTAKVSLDLNLKTPEGAPRSPQASAAHVSLSSIFNCQRSDNKMSSSGQCIGFSPIECRSRAALNLKPTQWRTAALAAGAARLVGEAYIGRDPQNCQRQKSTFLNFLRRGSATTRDTTYKRRFLSLGKVIMEPKSLFSKPASSGRESVCTAQSPSLKC